MAQVIIAAGGNQGDRYDHLCTALQEISTAYQLHNASPLYLSEPIGPSQQNFLNGVLSVKTSDSPKEILTVLKDIEADHGRDFNAPKWSARTLDLDIIAYNSLVIQKDTLIIPHSAYRQRLFVLLPLQDLFPQWEDPETGEHINSMINRAPSMHIRRTPLTWPQAT